MKCRLRVNKSDSTTICEYYKILKPVEFRYKMLSQIIKSNNDVVMFIDTNSRIRKPERRMEAYFDSNNTEYSMIKINAREKKVLGMVLNILRKPTPKLTEKFIIARINSEMFTEDFFNDYISAYDIALGIKPKLTIEEMIENYRENVMDLFFDAEFFEEFLYDSILFTSLRTTIDIKELVKECE